MRSLVKRELSRSMKGFCPVRWFWKITIKAPILRGGGGQDRLKKKQRSPNQTGRETVHPTI
jgi:hypothetical protein